MLSGSIGHKILSLAISLLGMDINARHRDDLNPLLEIGKTVVLSDNIGSLPADYRRMMNVACNAYKWCL